MALPLWWSQTQPWAFALHVIMLSAHCANRVIMDCPAVSYLQVTSVLFYLCWTNPHLHFYWTKVIFSLPFLKLICNIATVLKVQCIKFKRMLLNGSAICIQRNIRFISPFWVKILWKIMIFRSCISEMLQRFKSLCWSALLHLLFCLFVSCHSWIA